MEMEIDRFVIEAAEVESMAKESKLTIIQFLPSLVKSAHKLARPPISKFHVGAVALGSSGKVFFGVNLEFPGLPLHHSVHAEQFLIINAAINGETQIQYIAVSAAPCGHCRQFMQEIRGASDIKVLITSDEKDMIFRPVSDFLPYRFGPYDLLDESIPLLLEPRNNGLILNSNSNPGLLLCNGNSKNTIDRLSNSNPGLVCNGNSNTIDQLRKAALEAANKSHAPYSGCPSGVALMDSDGKIHKGSYTESAAYNPSLGPIQAALVAYVAGGGGGYEKIVAGVLVEKEGVMVRQEDTARMLLKSVAPKCDFQVVYCNSSSTKLCV